MSTKSNKTTSNSQQIKDANTTQQSKHNISKTYLIVTVILAITLICCICTTILATAIRTKRLNFLSEWRNSIFNRTTIIKQSQHGTDSSSTITSQVHTSHTTTTSSQSTCIASNFDGGTYDSGESYTTEDGCQTCTCNNGNWDCTVASECITPDSNCTYDGNTYANGEEWTLNRAY